MIPYGKQCITRRDRMFVNSVLKSDYLTTGPMVSKFEAALQEVTKTETFVVSSGTAALHCAYVGIGIGPGDEVITPPNTFVATQATAAILGAKIVFADIDPVTGLICPKSVSRKITKKTKAIVLVDYAGQVCDIDEFRKLTRNRKIFLVEDAAHSLGSTYKNRATGSLADITTFSFFPTKNITTAEGGAVSSPIPNILDKAKSFARQGVVRDKNKFTGELQGEWVYEVHSFGLNYRLSDVQCALGLSQIGRLPKLKKQRSEIFQRYKRKLDGLAGVKVVEKKCYGDPMWHLFPLLVEKNLRGPLFEFLKQNSIQPQVNYIPVVCHPIFKSMGYEAEEFPMAMKFYEEEISLPMFPELKDKQIDHICDTVTKFVKSHS